MGRAAAVTSAPWPLGARSAKALTAPPRHGSAHHAEIVLGERRPPGVALTEAPCFLSRPTARRRERLRHGQSPLPTMNAAPMLLRMAAIAGVARAAHALDDGERLRVANAGAAALWRPRRFGRISTERGAIVRRDDRHDARSKHPKSNGELHAAPQRFGRRRSGVAGTCSSPPRLW